MTNRFKAALHIRSDCGILTLGGRKLNVDIYKLRGNGNLLFGICDGMVMEMGGTDTTCSISKLYANAMSRVFNYPSISIAFARTVLPRTLVAAALVCSGGLRSFLIWNFRDLPKLALCRSR